MKTELSYFPVHLSPLEEQAVSLTTSPGKYYAGVTGVNNALLDYAILRVGLRKKIADLELMGGLGYSNDGRGLMVEAGADYPITNSLLASYRHYSNPNRGDDGSDFLGLTWRFE